MKKKSMIWILVVLLIVSMTGCSKTKNADIKKDDESGDTSVTLTLWGSEEDQELLNSMVEEFKKVYADEASFDITVAVQGEATCKDVLLDGVEAGADVFTFADDQLQTMVAAGALEPVSNADEVKSANVESSVEAASVNDTLYAYPMTADNGYFLYYNKKYLKESDVAALDDILEVCNKENKKFSMDWTSGWYLYSFFGLTGMEVGLNEDGITNYCNWNRKDGDINGVDVAKAMAQIADNAGFVSYTDEKMLKGVQNNEVIAAVSGTWNASEIAKVWGENIGALKLPTYTCAGQQIQMASFAGYKMVGVNAYSVNKDWAMKLADWITNEENQKKRFEERGQGPSNINAVASDAIQKSVAIQAVTAQAEYSSLQRVGINYWEPLAAYGETMMKGSAAGDLQKILDKLVKEMTASTTY